MGYNSKKHDLGILRTDGTTTCGFILARDKNGVPIYQTFDDEYMARQQTAVAGYEGLPPEKEFRVGQDDWRAGFGLNVYDEDDPKRYSKSWNMDLRHKGMAVCSFASGSITGDSEVLWTSPTNFVDGASAWEDETKAYDDDTDTYAYDAAVVASNWSEYLELTVASMTVIGVRWWVTTYFEKVSIDLFYDADSGADWHNVYEATAAAVGEWKAINITSVAGVTAARIKGWNSDSGAQDFKLYEFDFMTTGGAASIVKDVEDFNSLLYIARGETIFKLNDEGTAYTRIGAVAYDITDLQTFGSTLYIACGGTHYFYYMNTSNVIYQSDSKAELFCAVGDTMWKSILVGVYSATSPSTNAGWSGATAVDTAQHNILELLTDGTWLIIKKEDRSFYITAVGGSVATLLEETRHLTEDTTGRCGTVWQGKAYIGCGTQSLVEYDAGTISWRSPAKFCTDLPEYVGRVQGVVGDEEYLYAVVDYGDYAEILAGRLETLDTTATWVWHPINEITITGCQVAYISSVVEKRLWITSTATGDNLFYIPLPAGYGDITADANRIYAIAVAPYQYFITPFHHANFKGDSKAWIKVTLTMSATVSSTKYFTVEYQLFGSTNWTTVGTFNSPPTQTKYIPVDDVSGVNPVSTMIRFKISLTTNNSLVTPILYSYDVRGIVYPTKRNLIYCVVRCADGITLNDGQEERANDAANIKTVLEEAQVATWPVEFYDMDYDPTNATTIAATVKYVRFLPSGRPFCKVTKKEKGKKMEREFELLLQEVALS